MKNTLKSKAVKPVQRGIRMSKSVAWDAAVLAESARSPKLLKPSIIKPTDFCVRFSRSAITITPGMRVLDQSGPGEPFEGVAVAVGKNGVAFIVDNAEDANGDIVVAEWDTVAIVAGKPAAVVKERVTDPRWEAVKQMFTNDPLIAPSLAKIEKFSGKTPPLVWFASALHWLANWTHDKDLVHKNLIDMLAEGVGQTCSLDA